MGKKHLVHYNDGDAVEYGNEDLCRNRHADAVRALVAGEKDKEYLNEGQGCWKLGADWQLSHE